jgi:hypothetical protein
MSLVFTKVFVRRFSLQASFFLAAISLTSLRADTVYLKNGAWIDGRVRSRNDKVVEIEIGKIGKMEINVEEIHEIEKNNRTGDETYDRTKEEKDGVESGVFRLTREGKRVTAEKKDGSRSSEDDAADADGPESKDRRPDGAKDKGGPDPKASSKIDPELKARIEQLVQDLERQKTQVRVRAERHLKAIGSPALPFLIPLAKRDSDLTRIAIQRLFSEFGDESVIETLIDSLSDSSEYVRDLANKSLQRITHEDFGFQAQATPRRRENAQEKWKKWWDGEKAALAKDQDLSTKDRK